MAGARLARDRLDRMISILGRSLRFYRMALLTVALGGALSVVYAVKRPRVYKSETLILYRETIRTSALGEESVSGDPARKLGMRLKEMVLSRTQLQQIIEEFKLYPAIVDDRGYVDAVDEMRNHIAFRVRDGDTFGLSFEAGEPKLVQAVTARLAEALIEANSKHRVEQATVTKDFLDTESERLEGELKVKETELAKFLAAHPEFAKEGATGAMRQAKAPIGPAAAKDPNLLALEREAARIETRLGVPQRKPAGPIIESKPVQEAEADLAAAQRDLADKQAHLTDQHPDVLAARAHVKAAELRVQRVRALESNDPAPPPQEGLDEHERADLESALQRINVEILTYRSRSRRAAAKPGVSDESESAQSAAGANRIVAIETEWTRINREVADARQRRIQLEDKQFKASIAASSVSSERNAQITIVDPATLPTHPAKPGRATVAGAGIMASLLLALGLALGRALLDDRIYDRVDIEKLDLLRLVAVVPRSTKRERHLAAQAAADSVTTDRIAALARSRRG